MVEQNQSRQPVGALAGLRVLETAEGIAGAYCGLLLAGMGAEVIKVEPPSGDPARADGPFPGDLPHPERSARFLHLHRGKRGVIVDPNSENGRVRLITLLDAVDAVLDDHPPAERERLGLDATLLRTTRPALVLTLISWFGEEGPQAGWQGSELIAQAASGLMACTGEPGREPLQVGGAPAQYAAGQTAAAATLVALLRAVRSGEGGLLDISVQEAAADLLEMWSHGAYQGRPMPRLGSRHNSNYPFEVYPCADGYVGVHASPAPWSAMAELMDARLADPRYEARATRERYRDEIDPIIREWLAGKGKVEAYHAGQARRFAFGYVATAADLLESAHLRARDALPSITHPEAGTLRYPGAPYRMNATPWRDARAPMLGEDRSDLTRITAPAVPPSFAGKGATPESPGLPESHSKVSTESRSATIGLGSPIPRGEGMRGGRSALPLAGVRVVDLTQIWAGPRCTKVLADWGADVIKVESHKRTDSTRAYDAFLASPEPHDETAERAHNRRHQYEQLHRGQRSVTIDPTVADGRGRLLDLVRVSDVLVANFAYGVLERLGIAYPDLAAVRPDVIVLSMTGFGDSGPERDYVAFGVTQEELCGIYALTGYAGERPLKSGSNIGDPMNGMHGACAVAAALLHRERTGQGQYIELSQLESSLPLVGEVVLDAQMNGRNGGPAGNTHPRWIPHGVYPCRGEDQWLALACRDDAEWRAFCAAIDRPELSGDPCYAGAEARRRHAGTLDREIAAWTLQRDAREAATLLQAHGVPATPVLNSVQVGEDRHLHARGFLPVLRHPDGVERGYYGPLWRVDGRRPALRGPAPLLGEHNAEVFHGLLGVE
jgi:crotonobetainyl-CoA:carnitine CoA-transferase CaiB-like acyl-CoA transferase